MSRILVEQLVDLLARWDAIIEEVELRCADGCAPAQAAYYAGFMHGAQAARDDLAQALARLMQAEGIDAGL